MAQQPEIVVGIDFGMTCTGVSVSSAPDWESPKTIQTWPGKRAQELVNKVATAIAYDGYTGRPGPWGFLCENIDEEKMHVQEFFKLHLDPAFQDRGEDAPSCQEAQRWFCDYLHCLLGWIEETLDATIPRYEQKRVEFLFSVPTTWKNPAMIAGMEKIIRNAGYGKKRNHVAKISLTEAEAAAVYTAKQSFEKDDVFLVCDAGGGTTDVNLLKVTSASRGNTELIPLGSVEGQAIGSTLINFHAKDIIMNNLEAINTKLPGDLDSIAEKILHSEFEHIKRSFGHTASNLPVYHLPVPGLPRGLDIPHACIQNSSMLFKREDLQRLFDEQITRMFKLIDEQLSKMQLAHAGENISYLVTSGGFGSSEYLRQRLKERYEVGAGSQFPNCRNMKILLTKDPQRAVCDGLVMNRIQEITSNHTMLPRRCCRVSYGVLCREEYDPKKHIGEDVSIDERDGKRWAERQIHWIIKQGQIISVENGIMHHYRLKLNLGAETSPWRTQIVMSGESPDRLPRSLRGNSSSYNSSPVTKVCELESTLNPTDMKLKNRHWYNLAREYYRADFDMKVFIGPADLRFELWGKDGRRNKDHEAIAVEWEAPRYDSAHSSQDGRPAVAMYRA